jgi:hypothetical protein
MLAKKIIVKTQKYQIRLIKINQENDEGETHFSGM